MNRYSDKGNLKISGGKEGLLLSVHNYPYNNNNNTKNDNENGTTFSRRNRNSLYQDVEEALKSLLWQPYEYQNNGSQGSSSLSSLTSWCSNSSSSNDLDAIHNGNVSTDLHLQQQPVSMVNNLTSKNLSDQSQKQKQSRDATFLQQRNICCSTDFSFGENTVRSTSTCCYINNAYSNYSLNNNNTKTKSILYRQQSDEQETILNNRCDDLTILSKNFNFKSSVKLKDDAGVANVIKDSSVYKSNSDEFLCDMRVEIPPLNVQQQNVLRITTGNGNVVTRTTANLNSNRSADHITSATQQNTVTNNNNNNNAGTITNNENANRMQQVIGGNNGSMHFNNSEQNYICETASGENDGIRQNKLQETRRDYGNCINSPPVSESFQKYPQNTSDGLCDLVNRDRESLTTNVAEITNLPKLHNNNENIEFGSTNFIPTRFPQDGFLAKNCNMTFNQNLRVYSNNNEISVTTNPNFNNETVSQRQNLVQYNNSTDGKQMHQLMKISPDKTEKRTVDDNNGPHPSTANDRITSDVFQGLTTCLQPTTTPVDQMNLRSANVVGLPNYPHHYHHHHHHPRQLSMPSTTSSRLVAGNSQNYRYGPESTSNALCKPVMHARSASVPKTFPPQNDIRNTQQPSFANNRNNIKPQLISKQQLSNQQQQFGPLSSHQKPQLQYPQQLSQQNTQAQFSNQQQQLNHHQHQLSSHQQQLSQHQQQSHHQQLPPISQQQQQQINQHQQQIIQQQLHNQQQLNNHQQQLNSHQSQLSHNQQQYHQQQSNSQQFLHQSHQVQLTQQMPQQPQQQQLQQQQPSLVNVNYYRAVPVNIVSTVGNNVSNVNIVPVSQSQIVTSDGIFVSTPSNPQQTTQVTHCTEVIVHNTEQPSQPPVVTRTFTSTEAQTDDTQSSNNREQRRRERRERRHHRRTTAQHRHDNNNNNNNNNNSQWNGSQNDRLPDILNSHLPPPYTPPQPQSQLNSQLPPPQPVTNVPPPPNQPIVPPPGTVIQTIVPNNLVPNSVVGTPIVPFPGGPVVPGRVPIVQSGAPVHVPVPVPTPTGFRFNFPPNGFRR